MSLANLYLRRRHERRVQLGHPWVFSNEVAIERNLKILQRVQEESGASILLALKAFSMFSLAPLVMRYLKGTCASAAGNA